MFFGDSNAERYAPRIEMLVKASNNSLKSLVFATLGGLCPIPNVGKSEKEVEFTNKVLEYAYTSEVQTITITGQWMNYLSGKSKIYLYHSSEKNKNLSEYSSLNLAVNELKNFISKLISQDKKVYIISSIPYGKEYSPKNFFIRDFLGNWQFLPKHVSKNNWEK